MKVSLFLETLKAGLSVKCGILKISVHSG